ncbi:MAG: efflux RND transporter periplasmic adaptor subunit [bacterium]|nr:efflux RND transporter periplasmic adaptor subunit [bacterium]
MMLNKLKHWWPKSKWLRRSASWRILIPTGIALVLAGGYYFVWGAGATPELVVVDRGPVTQSVVLSGKTKAGTAVDLAFEKSGQVARVTAQVGEKVKVNQVIVALEAGELNAQFLEAKANLAAEEIKLQDLQNGTRGEELLLYQSQHTDAQALLKQRVRESYTLADDAIHNLADQVFVNSNSSSADILVPISDGNLRTDILVERFKLEGVFNDWSLKMGDRELARANLLEIKNFLDSLATVVNSSGISDTTFNTYKTNIYSARTNINTGITNLTNAEEKLNSASRELELKQAGNTPGEIEGQVAKVDQTRAKLLNIGAQLKKTLLISPINGLVTKQDAKVGEIAGAGQSLVAISSNGQLEVEAYVPEVHIGRLAVGNEVKIILEALKDETFTGRVIMIDPDATLVSSVPNYKIVVVLGTTDQRLRTGLTANLTVETQKRDNVLRLPRFALVPKDKLYFVHKAGLGSGILTPVTVGLLGTDGFAEITAGLAPGDQVVVSE